MAKGREIRTLSRYGAWRSLVAHLLWEQGVPGSNPGAPMRERPAKSSVQGRNTAKTLGCAQAVSLRFVPFRVLGDCNSFAARRKTFAIRLQRHPRAGRSPSIGPLCGERGRCQTAGGGRMGGGNSHGGKRVARATGRRVLWSTSLVVAHHAQLLERSPYAIYRHVNNLNAAEPGSAAARSSGRSRGRVAQDTARGRVACSCGLARYGWEREAGGVGDQAPVGRAPAGHSSLDRASISAWVAVRAPGRHCALSNLRGRAVVARGRADRGVIHAAQ
jgi:hypothetical protein